MNKKEISFEQLKELAGLICDIDFEKQSPEKIKALVEKAHDLIIEVLGSDEGWLYAEEDLSLMKNAGSEVAHVH